MAKRKTPRAGRCKARGNDPAAAADVHPSPVDAPHTANAGRATDALSRLKAHLQSLMEVRSELSGVGQSTFACGCPSSTEASLVVNPMRADDPAYQSVHRLMEFYPHDLPYPGKKLWRELLAFSLSHDWSTMDRLGEFLRWVQRQIRRVRGEIARLTASIPAKSGEPPASHVSPDGIKGKGVAPRNAKFLEWYDAIDTDTYHRPAKIRNKWRSMKPEEREAICPDKPGIVSVAAVRKGIERARKAGDKGKGLQ
jgi:hypothetical protein